MVLGKARLFEDLWGGFASLIGGSQRLISAPCN